VPQTSSSKGFNWLFPYDNNAILSFILNSPGNIIDPKNLWRLYINPQSVVVAGGRVLVIEPLCRSRLPVASPLWPPFCHTFRPYRSPQFVYHNHSHRSNLKSIRQQNMARKAVSSDTIWGKWSQLLSHFLAAEITWYDCYYFVFSMVIDTPVRSSISTTAQIAPRFGSYNRQRAEIQYFNNLSLFDIFLRILSSFAATVFAGSDSEEKSVVGLSMLLSISCHSSSL